MRQLHAALLTVVAMAIPGFAQAQGAVQTRRIPNVEGKVTVTNQFTRQVTIETKSIPGLEGKTMTVAYIAKDSASLAQFKSGTEITGELVVTGLDTYMDKVQPKRK